MKKLTLILLIWTFWLTTPVKSVGVVPEYIIYSDSKTMDIDLIHDEVMEIAAQLFQYADKDSYDTLLQSGFERFNQANWQAVYKNHELIITVGDGQGNVVGGQFTKSEFCLPPVKPKSIVREWLGF